MSIAWIIALGEWITLSAAEFAEQGFCHDGALGHAGDGAGLAGLGAALGGIGGLLGIGGGLLAIPVLALLFGMEQAMAQGTALVMIVPNVLLAFYRYRQHHAISLRLALGLGALAMLTSYPAARLAVTLDHLTPAMGIHCLPAGLVRLSELAGGAPAAA